MLQPYAAIKDFARQGGIGAVSRTMLFLGSVAPVELQIFKNQTE